MPSISGSGRGPPKLPGGWARVLAASTAVEIAMAMIRAKGRDGMAVPPETRGTPYVTVDETRRLGDGEIRRWRVPRDGVDDAIVLEVDRERRIVPARDRRVLWESPADGGMALRRRAVRRFDGRHRHAGLRPRIDALSIDFNAVDQQRVGLRAGCREHEQRQRRGNGFRHGPVLPGLPGNITP